MGEPYGYKETGQKGPLDGEGSSLASAPEMPWQLAVEPAGESPLTALPTALSTAQCTQASSGHQEWLGNSDPSVWPLRGEGACPGSHSETRIEP